MRFSNFLLLVLVFSNCKAQNNLETLSIKYEAVTRGSAIELEASAVQLVYKDVEVSKIIRPTPSVFWNGIKEIVGKMQMEEIESYKAPTNNRIRDAALHATLMITLGDKTYSSQTFDHGNPPEELKSLIDLLFKIISEK